VIQPHVVYDQATRRFFLSALEVDLDTAGAPAASRVWLAYSANGVTWTPVPLTARSAVTLYDQPIIAADRDKVVVAFTARPIGGGTGSGEIKVIQKSDLVSSGAVHQVTLAGQAVPAELAPAVTVTASDTLWLVADQQTQAALLALTGTPDQGNVTATGYTVPIIPIVRPRRRCSLSGRQSRYRRRVSSPRCGARAPCGPRRWTAAPCRAPPRRVPACAWSPSARRTRRPPQPSRTTSISAMRTMTTSPLRWHPMATATS
jgi:hypothetical protein